MCNAGTAVRAGPPCLGFKRVGPSETCATLAKAHNLTLFQFFAINEDYVELDPQCSNLQPDTLVRMGAGLHQCDIYGAMRVQRVL